MSDQWAGARAVYLLELCRLTDKYGQQRTLTDDNGQQITHCLYVCGCRMACFAARPTRPTCPTCPTQRAKSSKPELFLFFNFDFYSFSVEVQLYTVYIIAGLCGISIYWL